MRRLAHLAYSFRLRCPRCGRGKLFCGWFAMHERCSHCELPLEREPGFYLGSVYFNYLATTIVTIAFFFALTEGFETPRPLSLALATALAVLFPAVFFRYARALWLFGDFYFDRTPQSGKLSNDETVAPRPNATGPTCVCPFCHRRFAFPAEHAGKWGACPQCRGNVLLVAQ